MAAVSEPAPLRPLLGASIRGIAAAWLWRRVEPQTDGAAVRLAGMYGPAAGNELAQALSDLREAAAQWDARELLRLAGSADGSTEVVSAELPAESLGMDMSTDEAAGILDVSPRWVSQLAASGVLQGRKVGRQWLLARPAVLEYRDARSQAA